MTYNPSTHIRPHLIPIDWSSPAFQAEPLKLKLKRLEQDMINAEWEEDGGRITAIDYEIRMTVQKIEMGETHDLPF